MAKNPLQMDPTQTSDIRRRFAAEMKRRFMKLRGQVRKVIYEEDAFGLKEVKIPGINTLNTRWRPLQRPEQLEAFKKWLQTQVDASILQGAQDEWLRGYIRESYRKGAGRAFDDAMTKYNYGGMATPDYYQGTRDEFLRSSFGRPVSEARVKELVMRTYTDLQNVTTAMSTQMTRTLTDSFVQGDHPYIMANKLTRDVDAIGINRARTIARTETIRAHAEGQLDGLEQLGVEEVNVMVEWSTTGDDRVCPLCIPLDDVTLKLKEARGMIPRHPNCRCAWIPANVGESTKGQKRSKSAIDDAMRKSMRRETKKSAQKARQASRWSGADQRIAKDRPKSLFDSPSEAPAKRPPTPKPQPKVTAASLRQNVIREADEVDKKARKLSQTYHKHVSDNAKMTDEIIRLNGELVNAAGTRAKDIEKRLQTLENKYKQIVDKQVKTKTEIDKLGTLKHAKTREALSVPRKQRAKIKIESAASPTEPVKETAKEAKEFLENITAKREGMDQIQTKVMQLQGREQRAFHIKGNVASSPDVNKWGGVHLSPQDPTSTAVHELGHRLEAMIPGAQRKAFDFKKMRIQRAGAPDTNLKAQFPNLDFKVTEVGNKDEFDKFFQGSDAYYAGKHYDDATTEIISMGVEALYKDPVGFARKDPEYFDFIISLLRGIE